MCDIRQVYPVLVAVVVVTSVASHLGNVHISSASGLAFKRVVKVSKEEDSSEMRRRNTSDHSL